MASLTMVPVRCRVEVGGIIAGTPDGGTVNHVLSFNVDKVRGQPGSCNISLRVRRGEARLASTTGGVIVISAGTKGAMNRIFYGFIKTITISPCREYPNFVIMNITGLDILHKLDGKKYTRRCRYAHGTWVSITGVVREGLRSGKLLYLPNEPYLTFDGGQLNRQNSLVSSRAMYSLPSSFEKMSTNSFDTVPMIMVSNIEPLITQQSTPAQPQP